jgi:Flp pilus assembly pilin Flp
MRKDSGQATVEYILIFAFMSLISIGMVKSIGTGLSESVKSLGWVLTQELSTGVCPKQCFYSGYKNGITD